MNKEEYAICKSCNWSDSFVESITSEMNDLKDGNKSVFEHCKLSIDPDLFYTSCMKRLKQSKVKMSKLNIPHNPEVCHAQSSVSRLESKYKQIKQHISKYFTPIQGYASIIKTDKNIPGPYYHKGEFVFSSSMCELLDPLLETSLITHECEPGHHYMSVILQDKFPYKNAAIVEGWGLYVERFHQQTPTDEYGYHLSVTIRCCRAMIDILYNFKKRPENEVRALLESMYPFPKQIEKEMERMKQKPGFNVCYLLGEHFFLYCWNQFRDYYKTTKEYHDDLLQSIKECTESNDIHTSQIINWFTSRGPSQITRQIRK